MGSISDLVGTISNPANGSISQNGGSISRPTTGSITTPGANVPVASAVSITGTTTEGQTLTGAYIYSDPQSLPQSGSTYQWVRADDASGTNAANIASATALTYVLQAADVGKYVKFTVTPKNGYVFGSTASSAYSGPIAAAITNPLVTTIYTGTGATKTVTTGVNLSANAGIVWIKDRTAANAHRLFDTVRTATKYLVPNNTASQATNANTLTAFTTAGFTIGNDSIVNTNTNLYASWTLVKTSLVFDIISYVGTGSATTISHNLGAVPEAIIVKKYIGGSTAWTVYFAALGNTSSLQLNTTGVATLLQTFWNSTTPTSSVFSVGADDAVNNSGDTFMAYLFATKSGISKVGSYIGTGADQDINCGFTTGVSWVMIKRTITGVGDWFIWDSVRGISSGNDPYLVSNAPVAAEVTGTDYVDTVSTGFTVKAAAPAALNNLGDTYVFIAFAV